MVVFYRAFSKSVSPSATFACFSKRFEGCVYFHCAHFTFSQSHLPDFVWGVVLLRDDAFEAALPAFGEGALLEGFRVV